MRPKENDMNRYIGILAVAGFFLVCLAWMCPARAEEGQMAFASVEEAVNGLKEAVRSSDQAALIKVFGPAASELASGDAVQDAAERKAFSAHMAAAVKLAKQEDGSYLLHVGAENWPFPIPVVKREDGRWFFDTEAGKKEILQRRIGKNELTTIHTLEALVDAQREYAGKDRDADEVHEYAKQFVSDPGAKNGLFWAAKADEEQSPVSELVAKAQAEGYQKNEAGGEGGFHGYSYRMLFKQGENAPGGKYNYEINGNMIGGFAFLAYPTRYGSSGVMTLIISHTGKVYQKDLGEKTAEKAKDIKEYDPDETWVRVAEK
jgi:hypothetical protein